ncbi:MAG: 23S rRNA (guanosine(2251)-2'-O)-methyltransferase RlmB [Chitinophagales bacterium]
MIKKEKNLIYGRNPIFEALESAKSIDKLFVQRGLKSDSIKEIVSLAAKADTVIQKVPIEKLNRLTRNAAHQGVAGYLSLIRYYSLEDILSHVYDRGEVPLFLVCDGITDVRNFGAIARTALGSGVHAVVIPSQGAASINAEALKTSAGALNKIPVCKVNDLENSVKYLQKNGLQILATSLQTDTMLYQADLTIPTAIVVGAEDSGINASLLRMIDKWVKIPMAGDFDSFNVSVATAMSLYEVMRQRIV